LEDSLSLLNMLENLPEKAGDFASGVREKLESIRLWVQDHDKVTPKMLTSLQNMQRGAERWVKH
jgi:hypothetical protein